MRLARHMQSLQKVTGLEQRFQIDIYTVAGYLTVLTFC